MNTEYNPLDQQMDPALEQAMLEIRDEQIDPAIVEAAASRVWANLAAQYHAPLHTCEDFQAAIPDFKAGKLPPARSLLVKDHLHECVACRRVYEGRLVSMPAWVPVALTRVAPGPTQRGLAAVRDQIARRGRGFTVGLLSAAGLFFIGRGLIRLLG